jgi:hypothetical protein
MMSRMQTHKRLLRTALAGAVLLLLAAPASALPSLPVEFGSSTQLDSPLGSASADASQNGAKACADLDASGDELKQTALDKAGSLPVDVPQLPVPVSTPSLPTAGADTCIEADLQNYRVTADACADAETGNAKQWALGPVDALPVDVPELPVEVPELPVDTDISGADACAHAGFDDGSVSAGADAKAGPIEKGLHKTVDAFKGIWQTVRGLF